MPAHGVDEMARASATTTRDRRGPRAAHWLGSSKAGGLSYFVGDGFDSPASPAGAAGV